MNSLTKPVIVESGTPSELAERITHLPEGRYRVTVEREPTRQEVLAELDRLWAESDAVPDPAVAGMSDDEIMEWVNDVIEEERAAERAKKRA